MDPHVAPDPSTATEVRSYANGRRRGFDHAIRLVVALFRLQREQARDYPHGPDVPPAQAAEIVAAADDYLAATAALVAQLEDECALPAGELHPVAEILAEIADELARARTLFPGGDVTFAALVEEVGELAKATFSQDAASVRLEAVQVAVMAIRVALDGDASLAPWRARRGLDPIGAPPPAPEPDRVAAAIRAARAQDVDADAQRRSWVARWRAQRGLDPLGSTSPALEAGDVDELAKLDAEADARVAAVDALFDGGRL